MFQHALSKHSGWVVVVKSRIHRYKPIQYSPLALGQSAQQCPLADFGNTIVFNGGSVSSVMISALFRSRQSALFLMILSRAARSFSLSSSGFMVNLFMPVCIQVGAYILLHLNLFLETY